MIHGQIATTSLIAPQFKSNWADSAAESNPVYVKRFPNCTLRITAMWIEENHRFVRTAVPKSFDRYVDRLQDRDSVLFASISLSSILDAPAAEVIPTRQSRTTPNQFRDTLVDVDKAPPPALNEPSVDDSERTALMQRIEELERENAQKDQEIARLQQQIQKVRPHQNQAPAKPESLDGQYKQEYEVLKLQYDKLREALAVNGKVRRVKLKSVQVVKLTM
jgi:hypothetical protein